MALRWLDDAIADLHAIKAYTAEENPDAARRVIASIRSETGILINQPTIGRAGRILGTRDDHCRESRVAMGQGAITDAEYMP